MAGAPPSSATNREEDFDALAPETFDSPYAVYRRLRAECPVAYSKAWNGFWSLTRYADVKAALQDSETFITSVQNVVPKLAFTGRRPPLHLDPPEHTPYRRALNPLFRADRIAGLAARASPRGRPAAAAGRARRRGHLRGIFQPPAGPGLRRLDEHA